MRDVCQDIIEYSRHHVVGNEMQMLSTILCLATAYSGRATEFVPVFLVGELAGGKTHCQITAHALINPKHQHEITSASDKAPIYSDALREDSDIRIIKFGEYQKLSKPILEYLKSLSGDDAEFFYEVTEKGHTVRIPQPKRVYSATYAQVDIDPELQSRLFVAPIDENYEINRCVAATKFGAKKVTYRGRVYDFTPCPEVEIRLMDAIESLASLDMDVEIPFTYALIDMVNHSKAVSKRHANMLSSMIKSSARLNWVNRKSTSTGIIAGAQDVANVLVMFSLFRATTMGIDYLDMQIYERLCSHSDQSEEMLIEHLQLMGLAELTRIELNRRIDKLYNENYITRVSSADGYLYSSNKYKQVIELKVDWDIIYECDQSEVVDILTDVVYDDIRSFGKYIESTFTIEESKGIVDDSISEKDAGIITCVKSWLSEPETDKSRTGMASGIMNEPSMTSMLGDANYYDIINTLSDMEDKYMIVYENNVYRLV
jgi:hypothetical protein